MSSGLDPLSEAKKALGIRSPKPAISRSPLPTSLMTSSNSCSERLKPPAKKQVPKHSRRLASIEPRMAALMTGMRLLSTLLWSKTIKRTISTIPPRKVSSKTPVIKSILSSSRISCLFGCFCCCGQSPGKAKRTVAESLRRARNQAYQ